MRGHVNRQAVDLKGMYLALIERLFILFQEQLHASEWFIPNPNEASHKGERALDLGYAWEMKIRKLVE